MLGLACKRKKSIKKEKKAKEGPVQATQGKENKLKRRDWAANIARPRPTQHEEERRGWAS